MTRALLQQALDALNRCTKHEQADYDAIAAIEAALAEPQQPVAWLSESGDWSTTSPSIRDHHVSKGKVMIPLYK